MAEAGVDQDTKMHDMAPELQGMGAAQDALLALPEPSAELAWRQLPREALLSEVSKYRCSIRDLAGRLRGLGDQGLPTADYHLVLGHDAATAAAPNPSAPGAGASAGEPFAAADADLTLGAAAGQEPEDADLLQFGEEGLDYTVGSVDDVDPAEWQVPPHCVPIHANVTTFDWPRLYEHCQFDVIMMDPPWQLATANPTRGVALGYSQLSDDHITGLPVPQLQREGGFLFVWVINAKYKWTLDLFDKWGYRLVDEVVWVKMTVNRRLAKSHGYYLQHAKEVCLVAKRGNPTARVGAGGVGSDIIFSERRGQSQKPEEIYELIEQLVPNGRYLEIFARKNNLRDFWVSIGNEVTGTGLPEEDMRALKELNCIPGAVYGKTGGGGGSAAGGGGNRGASAGSGPVGEAAAGTRTGGGGAAAARGGSTGGRAGSGSRASTPGPSGGPARAPSPTVSGAGAGVSAGTGGAAQAASQGAGSVGAPPPAAVSGGRPDQHQTGLPKLKLRIRRPEQQQQQSPQQDAQEAEPLPGGQAAGGVRGQDTLAAPGALAASACGAGAHGAAGGAPGALSPGLGPGGPEPMEEGGEVGAGAGLGPAGMLSQGGLSGFDGGVLGMEDPFGVGDMELGLVEGDVWDLAAS